MSVPLNWNQASRLQSRAYRCGYCGRSLASELGFSATDERSRNIVAYMYICHFCRCPTLFNADGVQTPGVPHGESVRHISDEGVGEMYEEARRAFSAGAFTAAILCCRKLLMHVA